MNEEEKALLEVATALQSNAKAEAEASENYTKLLQIINAAIEVVQSEEVKNFLTSLISATEEKISDELNHNVSLIDEYVELTGINVAED